MTGSCQRTSAAPAPLRRRCTLPRAGVPTRTRRWRAGRRRRAAPTNVRPTPHALPLAWPPERPTHVARRAAGAKWPPLRRTGPQPPLRRPPNGSGERARARGRLGGVASGGAIHSPTGMHISSGLGVARQGQVRKTVKMRLARALAGRPSSRSATAGARARIAGASPKPRRLGSEAVLVRWRDQSPGSKVPAAAKSAVGARNEGEHRLTSAGINGSLLACWTRSFGSTGRGARRARAPPPHAETQRRPRPRIALLGAGLWAVSRNVSPPPRAANPAWWRHG